MSMTDTAAPVKRQIFTLRGLWHYSHLVHGGEKASSASWAVAQLRAARELPSTDRDFMLHGGEEENDRDRVEV